MTPIITDSDTGKVLWRTSDCADRCGIAIRTWSSYVAPGRAPATVGHFDGRTPLWDAEEVRAWHASHPGSPRHPADTSRRDGDGE